MKEINEKFSLRSLRFWTLQGTLWTWYFLVLLFMIVIPRDLPFIPDLTHLLCEATLGMLLSIAIWLAFTRIREGSAVTQVMLGALAVGIAAGIWTEFKWVTFVYFHHGIWELPNPRSFGEWYIASFAVMTSVMVLYYTSYYYLMMITEREMRLIALTTSKEAEIKMLRYQLNPHFMINTMNAISTLILKQDNKTAMSMVDKLSDFLSYSLDSSPEDKVELNSEIAHLEQFVGIERTRFSDRLSYRAVINDDVGRAMIPSMLLQPLVENAIKYAVNPREDGGKIFVQAYKENNDLHIIVSDDGPGLQNDDSIPHGRGVGLRNTQDRLEAIYGDRHTLKLRDNVPTGFIVSITIPCETLSSESS